jgi:biotin carboxylase
MFKKILIANRGARASARPDAVRQTALARASARAMNRGGRDV